MSRPVLLSIKDLTVLLGGEPLFEGLSMSLQAGELVAVVGANGCGKTTLLEILLWHAAGTLQEETRAALISEGSIHVPARALVTYLPQTLTGTEAVFASTSIRDQAAYGKICQQLGLDSQVDPDLNVSGGELQKQALALVFSSDSDLYILDEPTNYLDITGITAFEYHVERLKRSRKGIVLVTHDRMLTDNLADRTVLITKHGVYSSEGGASAVMMLADSLYESRRARAKEITKKIEQLQADARVKAGWSARSERRKIGAGSSKPHFAKLSKKMAKRAKAVEKRVDREAERLSRTRPFIPKRLNLSFPDYEVRHRDVFQFLDVDFRYPLEYADSRPGKSGPLLKDINLSVSSKDRLCLMGDNGSGKTTLFGLIGKELMPTQGRVSVNDGVRIVCVPQGLAGFFNEGTLLDNFAECGMRESVIRQYLGSVLIRRDKVHEPVSSFSQGELMRAAVTKCVLLKAEFLLLDEPTSHLDIESIEVLERLLDGFGGGFLMISHDRTLTANVAEKLYLLRKGKLELV